MEAFGAEFCFFYHVYGGDEYSERDCDGIHFKFYGDWAAFGDSFLGKHAVFVRTGLTWGRVVDDRDSGSFFGDNTFVCDEYWKLSSQRRKPQGELSLTCGLLFSLFSHILIKIQTHLFYMLN